jgi:hypothetical protein
VIISDPILLIFVVIQLKSSMNVALFNSLFNKNIFDTSPIDFMPHVIRVSPRLGFHSYNYLLSINDQQNLILKDLLTDGSSRWGVSSRTVLLNVHHPSYLPGAWA